MSKRNGKTEESVSETDQVVTPEVVKQLQGEFKEKKDKWVADNSDWQDSETVQRVLNQLTSKATYTRYLTELPYFFAWLDKTPDQVFAERVEDLQNRQGLYEAKLREYKAHLISLHFKASSINSKLGRISGFFSYLNCKLNLPRTFWKKVESEYVRSTSTTKRYLNLSDIKQIYGLADLETRTAILFGYHTGLGSGDVADLTWENIGLDFETVDLEGFFHLEHTRPKTSVEHIIVAGPDLLGCLKDLWISQGRPDSGPLFTSRNGSSLAGRYINDRFTDLVKKAVTGPKAETTTFSDLRDCYNQALLATKGISQEIKDLLFGHSRGGARTEYAFAIKDVIEAYKEVYGSITVNGHRFGVQGQQLTKIESELDTVKAELAQLREVYQAQQDYAERYYAEAEDLKKEIETLKKIIGQLVKK